MPGWIMAPVDTSHVCNLVVVAAEEATARQRSYRMKKSVLRGRPQHANAYAITPSLTFHFSPSPSSSSHPKQVITMPSDVTVVVRTAALCPASVTTS